MVRPQPTSPTSTLATGFIAGAVATVALTLYLLATFYVTVYSRHTVATPHGTVFIIGHFDYGLLNFTINLTWGIAYAYLAARTPQLVARPLTSGIVFGLFVLLMTVVFATGGKVANWPTLGEAGRQMIGYAFFYGLPLAYLTARRMKAA